MQDYVIWILTALLIILRLTIFTNTDKVEKRYNTSSYEIDRPLSKGMNKKVIGLMKYKLGGKIITKFVALRPRTYSYLTHDEKNVKKSKGTKKLVTKRKLKFDGYKDCLLKNKIILKSQKN